MKVFSKLRKSQSGQAIVEFVLILPILLTLVLGSIDAGWLLYAKISTAAAAREAARAVSVLDSVEYADARLIANGKLTSVPGNLQPVRVIPETYSEGAQVTVTVTTFVSPLVGFLPTSIIPNLATIESQVSMRLE